MITKIEVFSQQYGAPAPSEGGLELSAQSDPVQVRDIDGLGPVKAEIATTPFATRGALLQGSSTGARNIVLTLGLSPDWVDQTVASLRQLLYRYFMPEQWVKLRFISDHLPTVDIEGTVESCDPNIFSTDPEMQVSILCPKPDFIEAEAVVLTGIVSDGPNPANQIEFNYVGSVDTGFEMKVELAEGDSEFTGAFDLSVWQDPDAETTGEQRLRVNPITIDADNYLRISTVFGAKRVESIAYFDGQATNRLGRAYFGWPQIKQGLNTMIVYSDDLTADSMAWQLGYFNRFGGL